MSGKNKPHRDSISCKSKPYRIDGRLFLSRGDNDRDAERKVEISEQQSFGTEYFAENSVKRGDIDVIFRFGFDASDFH